MNWKIMTVTEKLEAIKQMKAEGLMLMEVAERLQITRSIVSTFAKKYNITWVRGGRDGNQNATIHGQGKNTIMRLTKRVLLSVGRDLFLCERCKDRSILGAWPRHHKNRDRSNNDPSNLEVLCHACHAQEHINDNPRNAIGQFQAHIDCGGSEGG